MRRTALVALALLLEAGPVGAQQGQALPRFVVDAQGTIAGLPTEPGWVPSVTAETPVPGHGWGVGGGAHVYLFRLGVATFGAGASLLAARKDGQPLNSTDGVALTGSVDTQVTSVHPQLSINFGHRLGWSYLSGGYGMTKITSTSTSLDGAEIATAPQGWNPAINFGGGARWFMKPHLAASFDVRFTKLSSRDVTPESPIFSLRTQLVSFLVGISIQ